MSTEEQKRTAYIQPFVAKQLPQVIALCEKYKVSNLYVFGSATNARFNENSDIDFLVYFTDDIPLLDYADNFFDFIFELENLFGKKIDLVSGKAMKNPYFIQEVENTKIQVYDRKHYKIAV